LAHIQRKFILTLLQVTQTLRTQLRNYSSGYACLALCCTCSCLQTDCCPTNVKWTTVNYSSQRSDRSIPTFNQSNVWAVHTRANNSTKYRQPSSARDLSKVSEIVPPCMDQYVCSQSVCSRLIFYIGRTQVYDRLCGLVVRVSGYRYRGPGFDPRRYQIFWIVVGLERGPLSLVRSNWGATWIKK